MELHIAPQFIKFAGVEEGDHVLDVVTGTGVLAFKLLMNTTLVDVIGIDPSSKYIGNAAAQNDNSRVIFEVSDTQSMRFSDETFNRCLSLLVVNFVPDPVKAVGEMCRVTMGFGLLSLP